MERNKKTPLLFVLLPLLQACTAGIHGCPSHPDKNLTCYNDFNHTITCVWRSTSEFDHADAVCTMYAEYADGYYTPYSVSCDLKPVDISRPELKTCPLTFNEEYIFFESDKYTISVNCDPRKQVISIPYYPRCHVKVNVGKPHINFTTISWFFNHEDFNCLSYELQWKREDQSWSDAPVAIQCSQKTGEFKEELDEDSLIQGEVYEARVRIKVDDSEVQGPWSDWSPTASWVSRIGKPKPSSAIAMDVWQMIVAGVAVATLLLVVVFFRTNKTTWVYMIKRIQGPPIPNPNKSFLQDVNFQTWLNPHFTSESFQALLKPSEIVSVEIISAVDAITPCKPDTKMMSDKSSSSFSNPSYSELCTALPISSLIAGNLEPCAANTPYGPVGGQGKGQDTEQDRYDKKLKEVDILKFLSKASSNSEPMQVISDYEKVEKLQLERLRLQSLDSGMCSCEEVSQESMEADSITMTETHDGDPEGEKNKKGDSGIKLDFQKLFGSTGGMFGRGSLQVCSDYERVQNLQADSPELPSLDSGVSSGGEEQVSQEESVEDKSTESTRFPSHPSGALPCSLVSLPHLPLSFSGPGLSPALQPPHCQVLEGIALMSASRLVEPSGDGYMPVRQEQS